MAKQKLQAFTTGNSSIVNSPATIIFAAGLLGALIWFISRRFFRSQGRLPPGPIGLPLVGVVPYLAKNPQIKLTEWQQKYGNVISFYMGQTLTVALNDIDAIKAAYIEQADTFSGRPRNFVFDYMSRGKHGVINTEGPFWREQRRFLMRSFHELGVGKSRFEELCIEEALCLVEAMSAHGAASFSPSIEVGTSVANVICALIFGRRFDRQDPKLIKFLENLQFFTEFLSQAGPLTSVPFLRHFPPIKARWQRFTDATQFMRSIIEPEVHRLEDEYDPQQEPQCLTEFYIQRRAKDYGTDEAALREAEHDEFVNMLNIITNAQSIFGAGTETSITTLTWCILFLLNYPEMQQRCYSEILEKVGTDRPVSWDDRTALPFVDAFLHEVWRRANVVPLGVARRTMEDTHLNGYFIPKHTMILPNMWQVHRDERNWNDALKFDPQRFLQADTGKMSRNLTNIPFGTGKRQCAGEGVARMEIFLFLANMIQKLEFQYVPADNNGQELPDIDTIVTGVTVQPSRQFVVKVVPRREQ